MNEASTIKIAPTRAVSFADQIKVGPAPSPANLAVGGQLGALGQPRVDTRFAGPQFHGPPPGLQHPTSSVLSSSLHSPSSMAFRQYDTTAAAQCGQAVPPTFGSAMRNFANGDQALGASASGVVTYPPSFGGAHPLPQNNNPSFSLPSPAGRGQHIGFSTGGLPAQSLPGAAGPAGLGVPGGLQGGVDMDTPIREAEAEAELPILRFTA